MRWNEVSRLAVVLGLAVSLSACGAGKNQNPVGSGEETGSVSVQEDAPAQYVTREGDTLLKIAGRSEIYADPELWPLIQEANADAIGSQGPKDKLAVGIKLSVPRGDDDETKQQAREKARQAAAASKAARKPKSVEPEARPAEPVEKAVKPEAKPVKPAAKAQAKPAEPPKPVPKAKKGGMLPVLVFLLLLLAALAAVLYWFNRKDREEGSA